MSTFIIDTENSITALTAEEAAAGAPDGTAPFTSEKELLRLATDWPAERLVEVWNGIPWVKAVTRFTSRKAGAARIWKAIQSLAPTTEAPAAAAAPAKPASKRKPAKKAAVAPKATKRAKAAKAAKAARSAKPAKSAAPPAREGSKKAEVLDMLRRKGGCTLAEIMKATGGSPTRSGDSSAVRSVRSSGWKLHRPRAKAASGPIQ